MSVTRENRKQEVIITGFGGQGIILAGRILGAAAALGDRMESTLVQSYGPESRGGACCAQVIVSDQVIRYPYVQDADVLICMSQAGYEKFMPALNRDGFLLTDRNLVNPATENPFSIPATRMAEELGRVMMANIIMVGFATAVTGIVSQDAARSTVERSVPKGTEAANLAAFDKGYDYGRSKLKGLEKKSAGKTGAVS